MDFVKDINTEEFGQAVLQRSHEVPVVVDFWAEWCGPCRTLSPLLEKVTAEGQGSFELVKVDVDQNQQLSQQFGVQGIPTVIGFRNGEAVARFTGALPESALNEWLTTVLPSEADQLVDRARDEMLEGNTPAAEDLFRQAVNVDPAHHDAGTGLASLLIGRDENEEALIVLGRLAVTSEVERLQAAARLAESKDSDVTELEAKAAADASDTNARLELGKALTANGEYEPGLDHLLEVVAARGALAEEARQAMLDAFGILGNEHPTTMSYRRRLANTLF